MFTIPLISPVTIPSLFGGTLIVPGGGAFIAALLIAALVGSALGVLRQSTGPHIRRDRGATLHPIRPMSVPCSSHHDHREAA